MPSAAPGFPGAIVTIVTVIAVSFVARGYIRKDKAFPFLAPPEFALGGAFPMGVP